MLKKTCLVFVFLTLQTTFYGFNADFSTSSEAGITLEEKMEARYVISPYDHVIRNISEREGNDWRLMSAIAYHESRFKADIVSRRGARGLMQIMPAVARQFDVASEEALLDPETNVLLANKVWNRIDSTLDLPAGISEKDRMSLILACYNGGIGHVNDARRLARVNGEDPNSWEVVLRYLELKSDPAYYQHEVVKCGKFTGYRQTRAFVQDVMNRYNKYCRIAQL